MYKERQIKDKNLIIVNKKLKKGLGEYKRYFLPA